MLFLRWNSCFDTQTTFQKTPENHWINGKRTNQQKYESCLLILSYQAASFSAFPSCPCKSQRVFLRGVYRLGIMKSLRESEAAGVNTRQGILSISPREPRRLGSLFLRLSPWIIKMLSHIKKYNAVYGRTINTASKLITFPLRRIIYFAALRPRRSHSPLLLSHLVDE